MLIWLDQRYFLGRSFFIITEPKQLNILYQKQVLIEKDLTFTLPSFKYPGLTMFYEKPDFKYDFLTITEEMNWFNYAFATLYFCFIHLCSGGLIELRYCQFQHVILLGLFKYKTKRIYVSPGKQQIEIEEIDDLLTKELYASIIYLSRNKGSQTPIKSIVRFLNDRIMKKNSEYRKPEKSFVFKILQRYEQFPWFVHVIEKKLMGLHKIHRFQMEEEFFKTQQEEYHQFLDFYHQEDQRDVSIFKNHLEKIVRNDLRSRVIKSSD